MRSYSSTSVPPQHHQHSLCRHYFPPEKLHDPWSCMTRLPSFILALPLTDIHSVVKAVLLKHTSTTCPKPFTGFSQPSNQSKACKASVRCHMVLDTGSCFSCHMKLHWALWTCPTLSHLHASPHSAKANLASGLMHQPLSQGSPPWLPDQFRSFLVYSLVSHTCPGICSVSFFSIRS